MKLKSIATAVALVAGVAAAQAQVFTVKDLGSIDNQVTPISSLKSTPGIYVDIYDFLVGGAGVAAGTVVGLPIDLPFFEGVEYNFVPLAIAFTDSAGKPLSFDNDGSDGFSLAAVLPQAGAYKFLVAGVALGSFGGTYAGAIQTVTAVPEPETYAMMLAGLGALGFLARRRRV